jgi:hypothetical protein
LLFSRCGIDLLPGMPLNSYVWAGGVAQVVEHLPRKTEALSSNPSMFKNNKKNSEGQRILLLQLPEDWDYRHILLCLAIILSF